MPPNMEQSIMSLDPPAAPRATPPIPHTSSTFVNTRLEASMVTVSQVIGATPAAEFAWRPPSPPHMHIPQAGDDQEHIKAEYDGMEVDEQDREILKAITQGSQEEATATKISDWQYELRRFAQRILPFIYLGPLTAAKDLHFLHSEGITMILVIRDSTTARARLLSGEVTANKLGIQAAAVDVDGNQGLIAAFPAAINIINTHLISMYRQHMSNTQNGFGNTTSSPGKVLVFCETGNERSAAVVAAYLMSTFRMDIATALQYIQLRRHCMALDGAMKHLLFSYYELLQARRAVVSNGISHLNSSQKYRPKPKRGRDDDLVEEFNDMSVDLFTSGDDHLRFEDRPQFVPFHDTTS